MRESDLLHLRTRSCLFGAQVPCGCRQESYFDMNAQILNRKNASELPADGWHQIEVSGEHPAGKGRV